MVNFGPLTAEIGSGVYGTPGTEFWTARVMSDIYDCPVILLLINKGARQWGFSLLLFVLLLSLHVISRVISNH